MKFKDLVNQIVKFSDGIFSKKGKKQERYVMYEGINVLTDYIYNVS